MSNEQPGFYRRNESWYWTDPKVRSGMGGEEAVDDFIIGFFDDDGCGSEFEITFKNLGGKHSCVPRISMFGDSWHLMLEEPMQQLFARLAQLGNISPDGLKVLLLELGFADLTSREPN